MTFVQRLTRSDDFIAHGDIVVLE